MTTRDIARLVGGNVIGPEAEVDGASIDSRRIQPGQLFVPVVAERDGHDYIPDALAAGAAAYLTSQAPKPAQAEPTASAIVVGDTTAALVALGAAARDRLGHWVIGITGSVGKTSTKDLLA
ncbi:MAG: Mur ligase domain-containing protein, partial [Pseudonocardiaceae bacterium]